MIVILGQEPNRTEVGEARDYCPVCDSILLQKIVAVTPGNVSYSPGVIPTGYEKTCPVCGLIAILQRPVLRDAKERLVVEGCQEECERHQLWRRQLVVGEFEETKEHLASLVALPFPMVIGLSAGGSLTPLGCALTPVIVFWPASICLIADRIRIPEPWDTIAGVSLIPLYLAGVVLGFWHVLRLKENQVYWRRVRPIVARCLSSFTLTEHQKREVIVLARKKLLLSKIIGARLLRARDY